MEVEKTSLKIFKHYKLKPSFSIVKDDKAKDRWGIMADQLFLIWPNFYISSNFIWTNFIQIINLIHLDPTWSDLNQFYLILTKLSIWSNLKQFEPISSDLNFQKWANNNKHDKCLSFKKCTYIEFVCTISMFNWVQKRYHVPEIRLIIL